jgi:hypothetical protein
MVFVNTLDFWHEFGALLSSANEPRVNTNVTTGSIRHSQFGRVASTVPRQELA